MSRRASLFAKQQKKKPAVKFPDELVFLDNIRENDLSAMNSMLRRASLKMDINGLDQSGLSPLHMAVLEGNLNAVRLLVEHGADVNRRDTDTWTPLHAACAEGHADIVRYLLSKNAIKDIRTCDGERPLDLADPQDLETIGAMLESMDVRAARLKDKPIELHPRRAASSSSSESEPDRSSSQSPERRDTLSLRRKKKRSKGKSQSPPQEKESTNSSSD